jgi:hypothetical protein
MSQIGGTIRCDGCGVEILLSPVVVGLQHFCCQDCASGMECVCAKHVEDEFEPGRTLYSSKLELWV